MKRLNRFTTLPVLLDLLERKKLVLLDPATWEDKNDSEIILEYKKRKKAQKLYALCFSHGIETIHHWKTFSDGISGCLIEFDPDKLLKVFDKIKGLKYGKVNYKKISEVDKIKIDEIPFTKRWPYRCEDEFRVIWEGKSEDNFFEIDVPLSTIRKITISQKMPKQVFKTIKNLLNDVFKNPAEKINKSTIYENKTWINKFKNA